MKSRPKNGLSYKIVGSLALVFLLVVLIFGVVVRIVFEETVQTSEKQKADFLLQTIEKPLQIALFLGFNDQIEQKVMPAISVADVRELSVYDSEGKEIYSYDKEHLSPHGREMLKVSREIHEPAGKELLGTVAIGYSDLSYAETRKSVMGILFGIGITFAVIFFVAVWWVRRLLSPLAKMAASVRDYKPGDRIVFEENRSMEIEQIALAFDEMQKTIRHYLMKVEATNSSLESAVQAKTRELEEQYFTDQLTGLPNRFRLQEKLDRGGVAALAIVNVDDFKEVNDFFGIDTGDLVLKQIANWLHELTGTCYRLGSDEFAIAFGETLEQSELGHRLMTLIGMLNEKTFMIGEESLNIRVTIGVAQGSDRALSRADIALHHAKENRKPLAFYSEDEGVEEQYRSNLVMAANVRRALFGHRIVCHYQPVVDLRSGKVGKYETLVRMVDEAGGIVPPMAFLPIAKQTKLYPQITLEVIHQACTLFSTREEAFSVNLSDSDIRNPHIVEEIIKTVVRTNTGNKIIFEILESEGIESYDEVSRFISRVKELGAKVAIDDFGTGYSNFENILKLNVDYIKIDGSLIREIGTNSRHRIIVETIIDFAQKIGARTIAEFVADEATYDAVKTLDVDFAQGYYTGRPMPLEEGPMMR